MKEPCEIIRDLLPLYLDGVCSEESRQTVDEHLKSCESCNEELRLMEASVNAPHTHKEDEKLAKSASASWKRGKRKAFFIGAIITLSALLVIICGYLGYHRFSTADGDDIDALAEKASISFDCENSSIIATAQRGNYLAALCTDNNGSSFICVYDRDNVFKNRWRVGGGVGKGPSGEINSWHFGSSHAEAVLVFGGVGLPDEARWYTFQNNGITYICPVENNTVLDIFVIQDSHDINGFPSMLNENFEPLE
ncbi:MAG: zf-HC2 domain-containing protein [Clostridia bacterium]|nr:zf-HC2 domain-containing protein [Clostridia bacterium]